MGDRRQGDRRDPNAKVQMRRRGQRRGSYPRNPFDYKEYAHTFRTEVKGHFKWLPDEDRRKLVNRREADKVGYVSDVKRGPSFAVLDEKFKFQLDDRKNELKRGLMESHKHHHSRINKVVHDQDEIITTQRHEIQELAGDKQQLMREKARLKRENTTLADARDDLDKQLDHIRDVTRGL